MTSPGLRLPFDYSSVKDAWRKIANTVNGHLNGPDPHPQYGLKGYGGIFLSTPYDLVDITLPVDPPYILPGNAYDAVLTDEPIQVTQDLVNGRLTVHEKGTWLLTVSVTADIKAVTANAANTVALTLYDVTLGTYGDQPIYVAVPRYGTAFTLALTLPVIIGDDAVDHEFAMALSVLSPTPAITLENIISTDFHAVRLA